MNPVEIVIKALTKGAVGPINDVGDSMDRLNDKSSNLASKGLGALSKALGTGIKVAAGLAVAGIGALAVGLTSSVMAAADFQQGIADMGAAMGASAGETADLKQLILDLGLDPNLKSTALEAKDAITVLGTAGVAVTDILDGAAKSTVLLTNATGADMGTAAGIASDAMALWGISAKDLDKVVNGVTATTIASKFSVNDYALALAQGGGVAATVGVGFDDFNTTIAAIAPYFSSGSDAGTSFKTFLQRLIPQSKDATAAMQDLGLITADGANQFFTATGEMKNMDEISGILNKALGGLSEEQKNATLSTIFGSDAMRAAAGIAGMTKEQFDALQLTMSKTDAADQARQRMDTLKGSFEIFTGVVDTLKLQIGDKFLPVLKTMVDRFSGFLQAQGPAIVEWAGGFADWLGKLVSDYLPLLITRLGDWWATGKNLLPTILATVAQVAAFAGLVGKAALEVAGFVMGNTTGFTALNQLWKAAKLAAENLFTSIMGFVVDRLPIWRAKLLEWGAAAWQWITQIAIPIAAQKLAEWGNALFVWVQGNLPAWRARLLEWANAAWQWITGTAIPMATQKMGEWVSGLGGFLAAKLPDFLAMLVRWATALASWIDTGAINAINGLNNFIRGMMGWGQNDGATAVKQTTATWGGKFMEWVRNDLIPKVGPELQKLIDEFNRNGPVLNSALKALGVTLGAALMEGAKSALFGGKGSGPWFDANLKNPAEEWGRNFRLWLVAKGGEWFSGLWAALSSGQLAGQIQASLQPVIDTFNLVMDDFKLHVWAVMTEIGGNIMSALANAVFAGARVLQDALDWMASIAPQWVKDALGIHSPSTVFMEIGRQMMEGMAQGVEQLSMLPTQAMAGAVDSLTGGGTTNNSTVNNNRNFNLTVPTTAPTGQPVEQVRGLIGQLSSIYAT